MIIESMRRNPDIKPQASQLRHAPFRSRHESWPTKPRWADDADRITRPQRGGLDHCVILLLDPVPNVTGYHELIYLHILDESALRAAPGTTQAIAKKETP